MARVLAVEQVAGRLQIQPHLVFTSSEVLTGRDPRARPGGLRANGGDPHAAIRGSGRQRRRSPPRDDALGRLSERGVHRSAEYRLRNAGAAARDKCAVGAIGDPLGHAGRPAWRLSATGLTEPECPAKWGRSNRWETNGLAESLRARRQDVRAEAELDLGLVGVVGGDEYLSHHRPKFLRPVSSRVEGHL